MCSCLSPHFSTSCTKCAMAPHTGGKPMVRIRNASLLANGLEDTHSYLERPAIPDAHHEHDAVVACSQRSRQPLVVAWLSRLSYAMMMCLLSIKTAALVMWELLLTADLQLHANNSTQNCDLLYTTRPGYDAGLYHSRAHAMRTPWARRGGALSAILCTAMSFPITWKHGCTECF